MVSHRENNTAVYCSVYLAQSYESAIFSGKLWHNARQYRIKEAIPWITLPARVPCFKAA